MGKYNELISDMGDYQPRFRGQIQTEMRVV